MVGAFAAPGEQGERLLGVCDHAARTLSAGGAREALTRCPLRMHSERVTQPHARTLIGWTRAEMGLTKPECGMGWR